MIDVDINKIREDLRTYKIEELVGIKEFNSRLLQNSEISMRDKAKIMVLNYLVEEELQRIERLFRETPKPKEQLIH